MTCRTVEWCEPGELKTSFKRFTEHDGRVLNLLTTPLLAMVIPPVTTTKHGRQQASEVTLFISSRNVVNCLPRVSQMRIQTFLTIWSPLVALLEPRSVSCETVTFAIAPESCQVGVVEAGTSRSFPGLDRNKDFSRCDPQLGLIISPSVSGASTDASALLETTTSYLSSLPKGSGVSFELWFRMPPGNTSTPIEASIQLITVGDSSSGSNDVRRGSPCELGSQDMGLSLYGSTLRLVYRTRPVGDLFSCLSYSSEIELNHGDLAHIIVSLGHSRQSLYVNGQNVIQWATPFPSDLVHWNLSHKIQIVESPSSQSSLWSGSTIYQLAVINEGVTDELALARLSLGLPSTQPLGVDQTIVINEDAEREPSSHLPEWYENDRRFDDGDHLPVIKLETQWLDSDVYELLRSKHALGGRERPEPLVYIKDPPKHGRIFQLDGTPILGSMERVLHNASIVYLPPKDQFSLPSEEYTNFGYCASSADGECNTATVSVSVRSVSDPPIPDIPEVLVVQEGKRVVGERVMFGPLRPREESFDRGIILTGSDQSDALDSVVQVMITQSPRRGHLVINTIHRAGYRFMQSFGRASLELNWTVDAPATVEYFADGLTEPVMRESVANDSFRFRVADQHGTWSREEVAHIHIVSSLFAENTSRWALFEHNLDRALTPPVVLENVTSIFTLRGRDSSKLNRNISYQIMSLPPSSSGHLVDPSNWQRIEQGTVLLESEMFPYGEGVQLGFVPAPNFQNYPCFPWKPTISACEQVLELEYRIIVLGSSGDVVSASAPTRQGFLVQNYNSPPTISISSATRSLQRTPSSRLFLQAKCRSLHSDFSPELCPYMTTLKDIDVIDPDFDIDPVILDIETRQGVFCLDQNKRSLLKGNVLRFRQDDKETDDTWCGRRVLFIALPSNVNEILTNSTYHSPAFEGLDELNITVRDGANCLDWMQNEYTNGRVFRGHLGLSTGSFHPTCFNVTTVLEMSVLSPPDMLSQLFYFQSDGVISDKAVAAWIFVVSFVLCCVSTYAACFVGGFDEEHTEKLALATGLLRERFQQKPGPSEVLCESELPDVVRHELREGLAWLSSPQGDIVEGYSLSDGQYRCYRIQIPTSRTVD